MTRYLLDTNAVSQIVRVQPPSVRERLGAVGVHNTSISVVTLAEMRYGLACRGYPKGLVQRTTTLLGLIRTESWTPDVAHHYAELRCANEKSGLSLSPLDLMIAAHASALDAVLVTADAAFSRLRVGPQVEDGSTVA
ncbi:MAG: type II toxin-antitoxin system VapC family toxin [Burkholderiales bacterium]|jgi:tRNA(fMet)-specific endonuclease VapC|nr:type II toxin-antitoxin system VapC family toxin [Burkholderiales bacterium]